jgi:tetratricopeptide (TPR) repeat protein
MLGAAVLAAMGAMTVLAPATFAQSRIGGDGRLMDASNRVGSGGLNDNSSSTLPPGTLNNLLVTGNVTGGVGFQGNVPYYAPGAFHGNLAGAFVDNFVAQSTNVSTSGVMVNNAQNVHLFVGDNMGINAPAGFVSTGAQPGYVQSQQYGGQQFTSDTRLGVQAAPTASSFVPSAIFQTGGSAAGGGASAAVSASPLLGVKTLQTAQQIQGTGQFTDAASATTPLNSAIGSGDRVDLSDNLKPAALSDNSSLNSALSPAGITGLPPGVASFATPSVNGGNGANSSAQSGVVAGQNTGALGGGSLSAANAGSASLNGGPNGQTGNGLQNGPIDASVNGQVNTVASGYPLNSTLGGSAFSGSVSTGENNSINVYSPTSKQPGSAYRRMLLRFKTINPSAPLTLEQQNLLNQAKFQDIKTAAASANKTAEPRGASPTAARAGGVSDVPPLGAGQGGLGQPGALPANGLNSGGLNSGGLNSGPSQSGLVVPGQVSPVEKGKPIVLDSFSKDEASPVAKEHLAKAEDFMKQGKFTSALEEYDLVEQQSPSNPYVELGRANAELGASYYGLAEAHLRQAFTTDEALLSAQLDLRTFLGEDKIQYLVKDLKEIAQNNPTESRPVFLLAYICYNTNQPRGAAAYLDLAQRREGKADPFFALLRAHWDLPDVSDQNGGSGLNK